MRWLRRLALVLGGALVLVAALVAGVYIQSDRILARTYAIPLERIAIPAGGAHVVEGRRLAIIRGCPGCHAEDLRGRVFMDIPGIAVLVAPNLTQVARAYSDDELARAIRHGVKRDGRGVYGMPSPMFYDLADEDLGAIIAYLRSAPAVDDGPPPFAVHFKGRLGLVLGEFRPETDDIDHARARVSREPLGRYLAATSCTECHGAQLTGDGFRSPDLGVAVAYSAEQFAHLMRTGEAIGGRKLELMGRVARERFRHLHDDEIAALYGYLRERAARAASPPGG